MKSRKQPFFLHFTSSHHQAAFMVASLFSLLSWRLPSSSSTLPPLLLPSSPYKNTFSFTSLPLRWTRTPRYVAFPCSSSQDSHSPSPAPDAAPRKPPCSSSSLCLTVSQSIHSGETVEYPGTIVVNGDVHDGASISAAGNVIVLGYLDGEVHAGTDGDKKSIIFAWKLKTKHLSIAHDVEGLTVDKTTFGDLASLSDGSKFQTVMKENLHNMGTGDKSDIHSLFVNILFSFNMQAMKRSSRVACFTGAYIFLIGIALLVFPDKLFGIFFDLKRSVREWIRVGAVLAIVFGMYYIGTAWGDTQGLDGARSFYLSTVVGRMFIFFSFSWLVATGSAQFPLFIVGAVNFVGALTMLHALRTPKTT